MSGTLTLNADGHLYVSEQTVAPPPDDDPSDLQDSEPGAPTPATLLGRIDVAMIESVPEPSIGSLAGTSLLILFGMRLHRKWRSPVGKTATWRT